MVDLLCNQEWVVLRFWLVKFVSITKDNSLPDEISLGLSLLDLEGGNGAENKNTTFLVWCISMRYI